MALDLKALFGTDKQAAEDGRWIKVSHDADFEIKIARSNNRRHVAKTRQLMDQHRLKIRSRHLPDEVLERIGSQSMAGTLLVDWRGAIDFKGAPLGPFSVELAETLLFEMPDFRELVSRYAADAELFREEMLEEDARNLPLTPAGSVS